jgi:hypothetical protein
MAELRPHLAREEFVATVRRLMQEQAYRLAYLSADSIKTVAKIGPNCPACRTQKFYIVYVELLRRAAS